MTLPNSRVIRGGSFPRDFNGINPSRQRKPPMTHTPCFNQIPAVSSYLSNDLDYNIREGAKAFDIYKLTPYRMNSGLLNGAAHYIDKSLTENNLYTTMCKRNENPEYIHKYLNQKQSARQLMDHTQNTMDSAPKNKKVSIFNKKGPRFETNKAPINTPIYEYDEKDDRLRQELPVSRHLAQEQKVMAGNTDIYTDEWLYDQNDDVRDIRREYVPQFINNEYDNDERFEDEVNPKLIRLNTTKDFSDNRLYDEYGRPMEDNRTKIYRRDIQQDNPNVFYDDETVIDADIQTKAVDTSRHRDYRTPVYVDRANENSERYETRDKLGDQKYFRTPMNNPAHRSMDDIDDVEGEDAAAALYSQNEVSKNKLTGRFNSNNSSYFVGTPDMNEEKRPVCHTNPAVVRFKAEQDLNSGACDTIDTDIYYPPLTKSVAVFNRIPSLSILKGQQNMLYDFTTDGIGETVYFSKCKHLDSLRKLTAPGRGETNEQFAIDEQNTASDIGMLYKQGEKYNNRNSTVGGTHNNKSFSYTPEMSIDSYRNGLRLNSNNKNLQQIMSYNR